VRAVCRFDEELHAVLIAKARNRRGRGTEYAASAFGVRRIERKF
jgi:hypothetical protein